MTIDDLFERALRLHQAGRLADAETLYSQRLAESPDHAETLHMLGVIAHQVGRNDLAAERIGRAIALDPTNSAAHSNLGEAYRKLGRPDEAVACFRRAIELRPTDALPHSNLGNLFNELGRFDDAIAALRTAIGIERDFATAHVNLAAAFLGAGRLDDAVSACRDAIRLRPDSAMAHHNLGIALNRLHRHEDAVAAEFEALRLRPDFAEAHGNLGTALRALGRYDEAITAFRRAIELRPDLPIVHVNLALTLTDCGKAAEAIAVCREALAIQADEPDALNALGIAFGQMGRHDEAMVALRQALAIRPEHALAWNNLGCQLKETGRIGEAIAACRRAVTEQPERAVAYGNLAYALHFDPSTDEETLAEEGRWWNARFGSPANSFRCPYVNDRDPERRLRIGYVSADFRDHVVGRNLLPLFRWHDRDRHEIVCWSGVLRPDPLTEEFRRLSDQWRTTVGLADEELAATIRRDQVDILVDLSQHIAGNRLMMFAHRPSPVQVSFAGYPASARVDAISNRISDRFLEGDTRSDSGAEQVHFIDSFWCYDPCGMNVDVGASPAGSSGPITFGSLNNFCKTNELVLKLWARVLGKAEHSRLAMLSPLGSHRDETAKLLELEGIDPSRLEFVEPRPRRAYLELYCRMDIALDTFPYNGHTTSLDALWMGVPVVTLVGRRSVSRAGLSQLSNLGLRDLAADSEDEYVEIATRLAHDRPRLASLRRTLQSRMEASVLMDAPRFARGIIAVEVVLPRSDVAKCNGPRVCGRTDLLLLET